MKPLRIQVERVVRPIRASGRRKDRMREELLAHLTATYQEELARGGDEPAALARALQRFGDPDDLRREVQASVPFLERIFFVRLPYARQCAAIARRAAGRRREDSTLRYAARATFATAILWVFWVILMPPLAVVSAVHQRKPIWPIFSFELRFMVAFIGSLLVGVFLWSLCLDGFRRTITPRPLRFRNALYAAGWCALAIPITCGVGILISMLAPRKLPPPGMNFDIIKCFVPWFWAAIAISPFLIAWTGACGLADQKRYKEWESLPLD